MTYYAGLDVSLRTVNICVINDQGEFIAETKVDSEVTDVVAYLDGLDLDILSVGLEAGTMTQFLTYGLRSAGFEVVCMEARQVKAALSAMRNKTDKNDARGIAQLLRSGWTAVRDIIETDVTLSESLLPLLDARLVLYHCFRKLDNRTRHMAHADPVCQRLMSAPGVGFVTALTYKAGVDDPTRFRHSRTVAAHFGLTPRRFQSGEIDIDGHISRCGDRDVRSTLQPQKKRPGVDVVWMKPNMSAVL